MSSDGEQHDLSRAGDGWEGLAAYYFADELGHRSEVDQAAWYVAEHLRPPHPLSSGARYYLAFHLQCAIDFLGTVFPPQASDSPFPDLSMAWSNARAIKWVLIELWTQRSDQWLRLNAIAVRGPFLGNPE